MLACPCFLSLQARGKARSSADELSDWTVMSRSLDALRPTHHKVHRVLEVGVDLANALLGLGVGRLAQLCLPARAGRGCHGRAVVVQVAAKPGSSPGGNVVSVVGGRRNGYRACRARVDVREAVSELLHGVRAQLVLVEEGGVVARPRRSQQTAVRHEVLSDGTKRIPCISRSLSFELEQGAGRNEVICNSQSRCPWGGRCPDQRRYQPGRCRNDLRRPVSKGRSECGVAFRR